MVQLLRNKSTLRTQLSCIIGGTISIVILGLILFNYHTQKAIMLNQEIEASKNILSLELQQLDNYIDDLKNYSLQLRNNEDFLLLIRADTPFTYGEVKDVGTSLKTTFYTRADILTYDLYIVKQNLKLSINTQTKKVTTIRGVKANAITNYTSIVARPMFLDIQPTNEENKLLVLSRAIIDAPKLTPLAIIQIKVSASFLEPYVNTHSNAKESLCIVRNDQTLYYTSNQLKLGDLEYQQLLQHLQAKESDFSLKIANDPKLCVVSTNGEHQFKFVSIKSYADVNGSLISLRNTLIILGIASTMLTVLFILYWVRLFTNPLSILAHRLRKVGKGNFTTTVDISGSSEISGLSEDFNTMICNINHLIETTYIANLNEKTARLIALEAQMNPHFLFNTLQAISAEAIVKEEFGINKMITSLASLLRYGIKGNNQVSILTEMTYVEKYLLLQKSRFNERLTYTFAIDSELYQVSIPKISLLSLVENSLVHGFSSTTEAIHIIVNGYIEENTIYLSVSDNGSGITSEKLEELQKVLKMPNFDISSNQNIGLQNLASRLQLLYSDNVALEVYSMPHLATTISMKIYLMEV